MVAKIYFIMHSGNNIADVGRVSDTMQITIEPVM